MGVFIWHDWSRFVAISASVYLVWASIWGILYRKFFFDFINHGFTNATPPIPTPSPAFAGIDSVIVTIPLIQIISMVMGLGTLAFEYPIPGVKGTFLERNFMFKAVWLVFQATVSLLFYQGTNASLWSLIAAGGYAMAVSKDEMMAEAKEQRGRGGGSRA